MMFLFRKYKKLMIFLICMHSCKTTYIKKRKEQYSLSLRSQNTLNAGCKEGFQRKRWCGAHQKGRDGCLLSLNKQRILHCIGVSQIRGGPRLIHFFFKAGKKKKRKKKIGNPSWVFGLRVLLENRNQLSCHLSVVSLLENQLDLNPETS